MAKSFFDFRKTLSEDIDYSLKDLVYYNEDALKESMDKVEQYDQKHFKDGWQSIELTPPPENDSQETKEELQHIQETAQQLLDKKQRKELYRVGRSMGVVDAWLDAVCSERNVPPWSPSCSWSACRTSASRGR